MLYKSVNTVIMLFFTLSIFIICKEKSETKKEEPEILAEQTSPNSARIIATIIEIDSTFRTRQKGDLCSEYPCRAVIRIDSILGVGMGFPSDFRKGKKLPAIFKFTLMPTEKIYPGLDKHFPGLSLNSKFSTEIKVRKKLSKNTSGQKNFVIYEYKPLK